jgi:predicted RNA-binding Zn-ribbon protein involved in translation (DUF1610 family)
MQRRLHPTYARRTAQISFGLITGGIGGLIGGLVAKEVGLRDLATVLNFAFGACAIALAIRWFVLGETTTCPECGSALTADKNRTRRLGLTFRCRPCDILWLTQPEPGALEASDAEADEIDEADHDPDADGYDGEEAIDGHDPFEHDSLERASHDETDRKP